MGTTEARVRDCARSQNNAHPDPVNKAIKQENFFETFYRTAGVKLDYVTFVFTFTMKREHICYVVNLIRKYSVRTVSTLPPNTEKRIGREFFFCPANNSRSEKRVIDI